jgi:hypothetical protein
MAIGDFDWWGDEWELEVRFEIAICGVLEVSLTRAHRREKQKVIHRLESY